MELKSALGTTTSTINAPRGLLETDIHEGNAISGNSSGQSNRNASQSQASTSDDERYAPGVQKSKVQGEVLRWHNEHGLERIEATAYMEQLEQQVAALKRQV